MNTLISSLSRPVRACRLFSSAVEGSVRWSQVCWGRAVALVWLSVPPPPLFFFPLGLPATWEEPWAHCQSLILALIHCQQQESQSYKCVCSFWVCELSALVAILSTTLNTSCPCVESLFSLSLPQCCWGQDIRKAVWSLFTLIYDFGVLRSVNGGKRRFESGPHHIPLYCLYNKTHQRQMLFLSLSLHLRSI